MGRYLQPKRRSGACVAIALVAMAVHSSCASGQEPGAKQPAAPGQQAARRLLDTVRKSADPADIRTELGWEFHTAETRTAVRKAVEAGLKTHPEWVATSPGFGFSRVFLAAYRGQSELVALLLDHGAATHGGVLQQTVRVESVDNASALHAALGMLSPIQYNELGRVDPATVELLLSRGLDPNEVLVVGGHWSFPLHEAACHGARIVTLLLAKGADVHRLDDRGATPLHHARDAETARCLASAGALLDARDHEGQSPLQAAACLHQPARELVDWLVEQGQPLDPWSAASLDSTDRLVALLRQDPAAAGRSGAYGMTPLHWAARNGCANAARALIEAGADADARDSSGRSPLAISVRDKHLAVSALLLRAGASPDQLGIDQTTPLIHIAAEKDDLQLERYLLAAGADADQPDRYGQRALHLAADRACADLVAELIHAGASVDARRPNGETPLLIAIQRPPRPGTWRVIRELLEAGADANVQDAQGRTPLDLAADQPEVVSLLRKYGAGR